ncbi:DUF6481 family protein [Novosphingobium acidiphilum]|jgi:hypothetical protein|uniref:DUF6481 family protein n=1 Tax=Novosphingobium acidiphilum TaxID=505248 RepID=UPI0003F6D335|nr:DUF6481 family protein [Novosphingobium acidiphilum]
MAGYKEPAFQDRVAAAAKAREAALARLKAKPPIDPAVVAERIEKERAREVAAAERAAQRAAERAERAAEAELAKAKALAAIVPPPTEAERKAARDAKYAARKARKSS